MHHTFDQIAGFKPNMQTLRLFNVERVRSYLEKNRGCTQKECAHALGLDRRTVASAIRTIRGRV